ncbi:Arylsulfatase A [Arachidicoccus rhizosphaerae]|uniref:Arylsulfatase A n=2 Tax=Arachidicoccus rhizosphaerae TaxID=551991 RepID=A0A1H3X7Z1_9BACT|nr:Arylsulfatase A [Arachidicoccus rhizosphaerae]
MELPVFCTFESRDIVLLVIKYNSYMRFSTILLASFFSIFALKGFAQQRPNVLILYTDDLGYGDLSSYGARAIATPNIDWLAQNGRQFTDAHCTASTCTPSRFSILSGRYAWRKKGTNILPGNANLIIPTDITTLPKVFQRAGYMTGVVGKWHLGLGDHFPIDWNQEVNPGPREVGFDYSFIFPATADRTPTVFMENQKVVGLDSADPIKVDYQKQFPEELTGKQHPEMLKIHSDPRQGHDGHITNGIGRIGFMSGGKRATWTDEELGGTFNTKSIDFIDRSLKDGKPFFLYYAIQNIHVPRMPATVFKGKSKLGYRGDVILEMDHSVGVILAALKQRGILDNTIIIFSSDNGPVLNDGYLDQAEQTAHAENYKPTGPFRGGKYSALEGGTRVPFIVYWKGQVKAVKTDALFSQMDLMASFASLLGEKLPASEFTDSKNNLETLLGKTDKGRSEVVEQAANMTLGIVSDGWKYIEPHSGPAVLSNVNIESGNSEKPQLYHISEDKAELENLAAKYPNKVKQLQKRLEEIRKELE